MCGDLAAPSQPKPSSPILSCRRGLVCLAPGAHCGEASRHGVRIGMGFRWRSGATAGRWNGHLEPKPREVLCGVKPKHGWAWEQAGTTDFEAQREPTRSQVLRTLHPRNMRVDRREKPRTFAALEGRGCGEIGRHARLRIWCFGVGVRVPPPAHLRGNPIGKQKPCP